MDDACAQLLGDLVPGTDCAYYYRCLHYQPERADKAFWAMLSEWRKNWNGWSGRMKELRRRQHLLPFEWEPEET
ncbi:MAG TPA: hypothetical protein DCR55_05000 [Lentisphaeria bacterium]|nr:hypothetical protein [Lentisphaeria bacterium]